MFYYAYESRDGHIYCIGEFPPDFCSDYLLFDSAEECVAYWAKEGKVVDRYA